MKFNTKRVSSYHFVISNPTLKSYLIMLFDIIIVALIIAGISIFQDKADIVLFVSWFVVAIYILAMKRYNSLIHLVVSTLIAFIWVYIASNNYGYNYSYLNIKGMNLLAIMAWALGMFGVLEIFNNIKIRNKLIKFLIFNLFYWILLIMIEFYAYHIINIRDISSGSNVGLPLCDCMHAPWWMRTAYFTIGPLYYLIVTTLDQYVKSYLLSRKLLYLTQNRTK